MRPAPHIGRPGTIQTTASWRNKETTESESTELWSSLMIACDQSSKARPRKKGTKEGRLLEAYQCITKITSYVKLFPQWNGSGYLRLLCPANGNWLSKAAPGIDFLRVFGERVSTTEHSALSSSLPLAASCNAVERSRRHFWQFAPEDLSRGTFG